MKKKKFEEVTEPMVQGFALDKLEGGLSRKSIKDIIIVMKMILKYGMKNQFMEHREIDVVLPTERERKDIQIGKTFPSQAACHNHHLFSKGTYSLIGETFIYAGRIIRRPSKCSSSIR